MRTRLTFSFKKEKVSKKKILAEICFVFLVLRFLFLLNSPLLSSFKKEKVSKKKILAKMILSHRRLIAEIYLFLRVAEDVAPYRVSLKFVVLGSPIDYENLIVLP